MSSDQWLTQTGAELLAQVANVRPVFLVELDVPDDRVSDLYHHIARSVAVWTPEARMCLAVAAVQAAAHANQDEESFRELFFDRLKLPFDQEEWENSYGPAIRYCLEQHFSVELPERTKPYCYVGAVYRHAGVPAPARPSFCNMLAVLLRSGRVFTRSQYDESLSAITSTVARRFLESDAGYDFTQRAAHLILRIDDGRLSVEELDTLPNYQRGLFSHVLGSIREMRGPRRPGDRTGVAPFSVPRLALDRDAQRLVLQFDPKGVAAGAYKLATGQPVLYPFLRFPGAEPPRGFFVRTIWYPWQGGKWWCPGQSPSALFRSSDGSFVTDSGEVSCGFYHLVTSIPDRVPTSIVREEGACLDQDESPDSYYSILKIEISSGDDLSELGFSLRTSGTLPILRFRGNGRIHPLGHNIFTSFPPEIEILNWTSDFTRQYWTWVDDGSGERRDAMDSDNRIKIPTTCPSRYEIWLEHKASGRVVDRLTFSVVPGDLSIAFVEPCAPVDASVHIRARLPERWEISWQPSLKRCGPDRWQVPAHQSLVEGTVGSGGFRQFFSLRAPRASIRFRSESAPSAILWKEHLDIPVDVSVEGLPDTRCSIALEADSGNCAVCELGLLPQSGATRLTSHQFRDALETCGFAAAEFAVQLTGRPSFRTGRYFASSRAIETSLAELPRHSVVFKLPGLGMALKEARTLIDLPQQNLAFPGALDATPLRSFLCGLAYGAAKLENASVGVEPFTEHAPEFMKTVIAWMADAGALQTSLDSHSTVLAAYPVDAVEKLSVKRWRTLVETLRRQLEADLDLPQLIGEWRQAVTDNPYSRAESELAGRRGGAELTEAAQRYLIAFSHTENVRLEILASACVLLRHAIESLESDSVVRLISAGLLQLAYYHSDHGEAAANISPPDLSTGLQRLGASMRALAARCRGQSVDVVWHTGLGFAEISPRREDADLEASLGRQQHLAVR